ncbi:MAG: class I SAM-dependent methyltransferase [Prevotellaceae bacterium]|jgi:2-polyprenyl-3-methyl-5-hydroxy-6-metoxy-1,4-benzoquinol methylase|nr:class I SAM-dependent methyltransferase [Prevotellaceae bacterium]
MKKIKSTQTEEVFPEFVECPLCGADARLVEKHCPGFIKPDMFSIYHCPACDTQFSMPRIENHKIYEYMYGRAYSHYRCYPKEIKKAKNPLQYLANAEPAYWAVIKIIQETAAYKKDLKILEIGSGLGYFTYALNHAGYQTTGIDISESGVAQARQTFGDYYLCADVTKWADKHKEEYDVVFSVETIEHVSEALPFLRSIAACCKPRKALGGGGKIIVTTPNKSAYSSEAVWCNSLPPFHMWWLSETSMHYMAKQIDASVSFMDWSEYHRQNRCAVRMKNPKETVRWLRAPFLDENGYAIHSKSALYKFLENIPLAKRIFRKVMRIPEYRLQGSRGLILCTVFERE